MQDLRVSLHSTNNVFFANSNVTGMVYLKTGDKIKARKIDLQIIGRAKVSFYHRRGKHTYHYSSTTYYMQLEKLLWGCQNDSNKLPVGNYEFPFNFIIPKDCPPNIQSEYGNIRYYVKANIDIPWAFDKFFVMGFTVVPFMDLNIDRRLAMSVISAVQKTSLLSSKAVNVTISMPKMGYVCGESIPLRVEIFNESSSEVTSVESGIGAVYRFTASDQSFFMKDTQRRKRFAYYSVSDVPLPVGMTQNTMFTRNIDIPPVPPSFSHCPNINLRYHVFVKVHTSAVFSRSASASMPIVIGTVPLRQLITNTAPDVIGFEAYLPPPAPGIPPPDYDFTGASYGDSGTEQKFELKDDDGPDYQPKFSYFPNLSHKEKI